MTNHPREILKAAGVECADVVRYWVETRVDPPSINVYVADAAIRALARLVAKYKWQRDALISDADEAGDYAVDSAADLDRRWDEHSA